jgi:serine protease Do
MSTTTATDLGAAIAGAAATVGPAVAGIGRGWSSGSAVVVAPGRLITNAHLLRRDETTLTFGDGRQTKARVLGSDADADVAVLEADTGDATPVRWEPEAVAGAAAIGTPVVALANPGGRGLRATLGFVSATQRSFRGPRGRRIPGSFEHTAPLPRGSAGGPLVDLEGRLLGLNSRRLEGGLILALPADPALHARIDALATGSARPRPRLGIAVAPPHVARRLRRAVGLEPRDGLLVRAVRDGSPAAAAGVARGDLIVAAAGRALASVDALFELIDGLQPDATLALTIVRGDSERQLEVSFKETATAGGASEAAGGASETATTEPETPETPETA